MAYTPPEYPGDIPEFAEVWPPVDDVNWMYTSAWDALVKEVRAIMIELGVDPAGAEATVVARLDALGVGDVVGPGAALDEAIVRYNGTSGKLIQATLGAKIDDTGRLTNTAQPAFLARPAGVQTNIAINTAVTVIFGTEIFDQGNNFAANTFTAPVTGRYLFTYSLSLTEIDSGASLYTHTLVTSNRVYGAIFEADIILSADTQCHFSNGMVVDMDANDTAYVTVYQTAGTVQSDVQVDSSFSGALIC